MADMVFARDVDLAVPFGINEGTDWILRGEHKQDMRMQRVASDSDLGYLKNRYGIFRSRWPYGDDLYHIAYKTASMLSNWRLSSLHVVSAEAWLLTKMGQVCCF